ncbi:hypothetical protein [Actinacidiphila sp. bgisy160]|uniref:hypothetical protein n=1 Tax=Actinacidiphila sp. bgisy160 TaxID=3413796 RepID=UPI003D7310C2
MRGFRSPTDRLARIGAHEILTTPAEQATWRAIRVLMRLAPETGLRLLLRSALLIIGR